MVGVKRKSTSPIPFSFPIPKGWEKERLRPTNQERPKFSAPFRVGVKRKSTSPIPFSFPIPKGWEKERLRPTNQERSKFSAPFRVGVKRKYHPKTENK